MILIFYAFAREVSALKRRAANRYALEVPGLGGFRASIAGRDAVLVATGMGRTRAFQTARRAFDAFPAPTLAIGAGVAGALSTALRVGDVVVADRVMSPGREIAVEEKHLNRCRRALDAAGIFYSTGAMLTANRVLASAAEKRRAIAGTGAIAVDMETAVIAAEAEARGIPFASIRTIMDDAGDDMPGAELADDRGEVDPFRAAGYVLAHPRAALELPRILRNINLAARTLADALEAIMRAHDDAPG